MLLDSVAAPLAPFSRKRKKGLNTYRRLIESIAAEGVAARVLVVATRGSAPREAGTAMVVRPSGGFHGTIGGGALEWRALEVARETIREGQGALRRETMALGPDLGQCCGGRVEFEVEVFGATDLPDLESRAESEATQPTAAPLLLFGAGHVGRALALALAPLPFAVTWIDSRPGAFPAHTPRDFRLTPAADPPGELAKAPDGALVVVMTHSHPLDLAIVSEALRQDRFRYVGLIGSETKRARFESLMRQAGLPDSAIARMVCPIGIPGVSGKAPAIIAAAVAAQLLLSVEPALDA